MRISFFACFAFAAFLSLSCGKNKEKPTHPALDRGVLLSNYSGNIIVPGYQELSGDLSDLRSAAGTFAGQPSASALTTLRQHLKTAWTSWVKVSMFEFGPAENVALRANLNTFPADTVQIGNNITAGSWDLAQASNMDAKGFPALDFLLNSRSESGIVQLFSSDPNRGIYLTALVTEMDNLVTGVYDEWTTGNYSATFNSSTGTDVGSSTGMLVNQFNFDLEITKTNRLGIPLGKKTLGTPLPEKVEVYYGGYSSELVAAHLSALYDLYLGKGTNGIDGPGLYDYLEALNATYAGASLAGTIDDRFITALTDVSALPSPLSTAVVSNPAPVDLVYSDVQKLVVILKNDMPSVMGVTITYQDNDGD